MDVLVMLEESPTRSVVLAHVDSIPVSRGMLPGGSRDMVTLYGQPDSEALALALAAVVEGRRAENVRAGSRRHIGVWPGKDAEGNASWTDSASGELVKRDLVIPLDQLRETARELLHDFEQSIRRLLAGLNMPDWPEGARRAIQFTLAPVMELGAAARPAPERLLDKMREADAYAFEEEAE